MSGLQINGSGFFKGLLPTPPATPITSSNTSNNFLNPALDNNLLTKIELVTRDGKDPRPWIRKCVKYFEVYKVPQYHKVDIASLFLMNKADA